MEKWQITERVTHHLVGYQPGDKVTILSGKYKGKNGSISRFVEKCVSYRVSINSIGARMFKLRHLRLR